MLLYLSSRGRRRLPWQLALLWTLLALLLVEAAWRWWAGAGSSRPSMTARLVEDACVEVPYR